ncbi:MAG: sporulation integral membrane protein YtvI [Firmicutes bacterium]|nr:sporulation integral membrane protein YtvI [Bacillota bacterium]
MRRKERVLVTGLIGSALIAVAFRYAWAYFSPFLVATMLAAVIDPMVNRLHRLGRVGRGPAVVFVLSVCLFGLIGAVALLLVNLAADLERLLGELPRMASALVQAFEALADRADRWMAGLPHPWDHLAVDAEPLTRWAGAAVNAALAAVRSAPRFLFLLLVSGLATYFISRDRQALWSAVLQVVPVEWRGSVVRLRDEIFGGMLAILRAQLILVCLTGAGAVAGLAITGVPYAWLLGIVAAALDLVPMIGPGGVLVPVSLMYAFRGDVWRAVAVGGLYLLLVVGRQMGEPQIVGTRLGLHPLPTLMAMYAAVQVTGVAGFILGPLVLVVIKAFLVVAVLPGLPRR